MTLARRGWARIYPRRGDVTRIVWHSGVVDYIFVSDAARFWTVIVALWLIALMLRLTYMRTRRLGWPAVLHRQEQPHPITTIGLAFMLAITIVRRFDRLGQPGDAYLWLAFTGVTLVLIGVIINIDFSGTPLAKVRRRAHGGSIPVARDARVLAEVH